ncbi:MAG: SWIM zinc finger family protein, partial [Clostridia bacterium]|nr:SWIM zinc finger family protein [Clostridia bacterium]
MAESAADALVAFSEDDLLRQVPVRALADGQSYYARGRVRGAVRAGDRLAADVVGQEDIYRVVVHITPDGVQGDCTCPLRRQPCKHVAALLWAWVREPGGFADLDAALDELTPADARRLLTEQALVDGEAAKRLLAAADRRDADGSDGADPLASLPRALREAAAAAAPEPLRAVARAVDALWAAGAGASRPEAARASLRLVAAAAPVAARFGLLEGWAEAAAARLRTLPATAQRALAAELAAAVEAAWLSPLPAAAEPLLAAAESAGALPLVAARTWSSLWANSCLLNTTDPAT